MRPLSWWPPGDGCSSAETDATTNFYGAVIVQVGMCTCICYYIIVWCPDKACWCVLGTLSMSNVHFNWSCSELIAWVHVIKAQLFSAIINIISTYSSLIVGQVYRYLRVRHYTYTCHLYIVDVRKVWDVVIWFLFEVMTFFKYAPDRGYSA